MKINSIPCFKTLLSLCILTVATNAPAQDLRSHFGEIETTIDTPKIILKKLITNFSEEGTLSPIANVYTYGQDLSSTSKNFIVDAKLNANYFVFKSPDNASWFMTGINAKFDVRQHYGTTQHSAPVRTPSFKIGGRAYYIFDSNNTSPKKSINAFFGFFHYSNGQDGEGLVENAEIPNSIANENTLLDFDILGNRRFNVFNGSFSTNYIVSGVNLFHKKSLGNHKWIYFNQNLEIEYHHKSWLDENYHGYFSRLNFNYVSKILWMTNMCEKTGSNHMIEKLRINFGLQYKPFDNDKLIPSEFNVRNFNSFLQFFYNFSNAEHTSWFTEIGYKGSDDYNVYLEDEIPFYWRLGMATGFFFGEN